MLDFSILVSDSELHSRYYVQLRQILLELPYPLSCGLNSTITNRVIGLMSRVFTIGPGHRGSIPGWVIPKTQKIILGAALFSTQHYKVRIKGKVEQSREWSSALHYATV